MANPNTTTTQGSLAVQPVVVIIPISSLAGLINAQVRKVALPFNFVVQSALCRADNPPTTAAKLATLTLQINGVAMTGGVMALTTANMTPAGTAVAATAITGANGSTAVGQTLEIAVSGVTAFVEGDAHVEVTVLPTSAG